LTKHYPEGVYFDRSCRGFRFKRFFEEKWRKIMKTKVVVLAILIAAVLAGGIYAGGNRQEAGGMTIRPGVLTVGVDISYPPMEYFGPDGTTPMGFNIEMAKIIAERMGLRHEFVNSSWEGIFAGLDTRRWDAIISSVTITPARQAVHNFSKPYIANTLAMVLLKNSPITARTPEELTGMDVAFQGATTSDFYMEELAARGLRYNARRYDQVLHCFPELEMGRVDVIVTDFLVAFDYASPEGSPFEIVWLGSDDPEVFGICMRKGNDALTEAINKALEELFVDGTMQRISYNVFGMDLVTEARQQW